MNVKPVSHKRHTSDFYWTERHDADRSDNSNVFLLDPEDGTRRASDDLGEEIAESFLQSATSGQDAGQEVGDMAELEFGGPFVETLVEQEMALDIDASNPEDAESTPFPSPVRAL